MIQAWENTDDVAFVTFADSAMASARERIRQEAFASRFFKKIIVGTENDLPPGLRDFCEAHKGIGSGYGCYIWKPYIVSTVAHMPELASYTVFWIDAGSWINRFGVSYYKRYLSVLSDEKPFVVFEDTYHKQTYSAKRDVFHELDAYEYVHTRPIMAGIFGFRVNDLSRRVLLEWQNTCLAKPKLLDQSPSVSGEEFPGHQANRHDQGIFSLLLKKYDCYTSFPTDHILPENHNSYLEMFQYPFIAMRDRLRGTL